MIGRITYWNNAKGFGFITVAQIENGGMFQEQYFFHYKNFALKHETPMLNGIVMFNLGEPIAVGKKIQAINIRYATPAEIQQAQQSALKQTTQVIAGVEVLRTTEGA